MPSTIDFRRLGAEGLLIVVSILLALTGDAWWEARGEAELRTALVAGLASDFSLAARDVERVIEMHHNARTSAASLLIMTEDASSGSVEGVNIDSLLATALMGGSFDAPQGTVESVVGTASLDVLDDPDLAAELTAWPGRVGDLEREQGYLQTTIDELLAFLRRQRVDTSNLVFGETPWTRRNSNAYRALVEPEARSLVSDLWLYYGNTEEKLDTLRVALDRIRVRLPEVRGGAAF